MRKHTRGTGGGPATTIRLSAEEQVIARCLERDQVEGLEGYDSIDQALRTGKCVACVGVQGNM